MRVGDAGMGMVQKRAGEMRVVAAAGSGGGGGGGAKQMRADITPTVARVVALIT